MTDTTPNEDNTPNTNGAIPAHGGTLVNRALRGEMREAVREKAASLRQIILSPMNISDLELIATGAFSPLTGFMGQADYASVVSDMHLTNGLPWTIPVTLPVDAETANAIEEGQSLGDTGISLHNFKETGQ